MHGRRSLLRFCRVRVCVRRDPCCHGRSCSEPATPLRRTPVAAPACSARIPHAASASRPLSATTGSFGTTSRPPVAYASDAAPYPWDCRSPSAAEPRTDPTTRAALSGRRRLSALAISRGPVRDPGSASHDRARGCEPPPWRQTPFGACRVIPPLDGTRPPSWTPGAPGATPRPWSACLSARPADPPARAVRPAPLPIPPLDGTRYLPSGLSPHASRRGGPLTGVTWACMVGPARAGGVQVRLHSL